MDFSNIKATITLKSKSGRSIYRDFDQFNSKTARDYFPYEECVFETMQSLAALGLHIESFSNVGITISGSQQLFHNVFGVKVDCLPIKYIRQSKYYYFHPESEPAIPFELSNVERVSFPKQLFVLNKSDASGLSAEGPNLDYFHLRLPHDIASLAKVDRFGLPSQRAKNVHVVMIDTGMFRHEYYSQHGFTFQVVPAVDSFDIRCDERGHGTGMAAILLSIASGANFTMIKASDDFFSFPIAAFQKAAHLKPDIINCSWGTIGFEPHLYLEIAACIESGIPVIFSAGNGSDDRKDAMFQTIAYPGVISVGGCNPRPDGTLEVADISSSYESDLFKERHVPDVCGICGNLPYSQLVLMPTQPESLFDRENGKRDGTSRDDGWFVSCGTSGAAAYVTGLIACALPYFKIHQTRLWDILVKSTQKVSSGKSYMGDIAANEPFNGAVGYGFLDGEKLFAQLEAMIQEE